MPKPTSKTLKLAGPESEISMTFLQGMVNRMMVSFHKYGAVAEATDINCLASAWNCIATYHQTDNTEFLIDAANYLMMEFMKYPDKFLATPSEETAGRVHRDGSTSVRPNS